MKIGMKGYRLLTRAAVPAAMGYLLYRSRRQPAYRNFWGERFGFSEYPPPKGCPRVWVHAVSVGETNAAKPLIAECLKRWPEADFLLTHMTPTGRDAGKRIVALAPDRISQCYLPYDIPGAMESFFRETKPSIGIVMETEIWPTMMAEARKWGVPMVLANARESQKSLDQALRVPRLMIPAVKQFAVILAQSRPDAVRFKELGAERIQVVGSIKFDIQPDAGQQKKAREWKAAIGRPVVLFASSREGEEALFLEALQKGGKALFQGNPLFLVVPRHPQRFASVRQLFLNSDYRIQSRSELASPDEIAPDTDILLGDSMGEMSFYCALSDIALMGGSFLNYGCQNLIEPCLSGVPVIVGPSTFNFSEVAARAIEEKAAVQVMDFREGLERAAKLLGSAEALKEKSENAVRFASSYTGATERTMTVLDKIWKKQPLGSFPTF